MADWTNEQLSWLMNYQSSEVAHTVEVDDGKGHFVAHCRDCDDLDVHDLASAEEADALAEAHQLLTYRPMSLGEFLERDRQFVLKFGWSPFQRGHTEALIEP